MTNQRQAATADTGTDPAYVPDREVFDAYTHRQIWELARERLAPAELHRVADGWARAADAVESAFDEHARDLTRLSGEWSGLAATAAVDAATSLVRAGNETAEVCGVLHRLMTGNADAAESVRAAIPPPPAPYRPDPDPAVEAATGAQRRTDYNLATAAATAAAQDAMTYAYNPTIPASGDRVPRFPTVTATAPTSQLPSPAGAPRAGSPSAEPEQPATTGIEPSGTAATETTVPEPDPASEHADDEPQVLGETFVPPGTANVPSAPAAPSPEAPPPPPVATGSPSGSEQPQHSPAGDSSPPPDGTATETTSAAGPAPETRPAGTESAASATAPSPDRAAGTGPTAPDPTPRSTGTAPLTGTGGSGPSSPPGGPGGTASGQGGPGHTAGTPQSTTAAPAPSRPGPVVPAPGIGAGPAFGGTAPGTPPTTAPGTSSTTPGPSPTTTPGTSPAAPSGTPPATTPDPSAAGETEPSGAGTANAVTTLPDLPSSCGLLSDTPDEPDPRPGPDSEQKTADSSPSENAAVGGPADTAPAAPNRLDSPPPATQAPPTNPPPTTTPPTSDPPTALTDPVNRPSLPADKGTAGPAATAAEGAADESERAPRPVRLVPGAAPWQSTAGSPPVRAAGTERAVPDYLQAPNDELTATEPTVPPVLGEYPDTERPDRGDPGGGSR